MTDRESREARLRREADERREAGPNIDVDGRRMDDSQDVTAPRGVGEARVEREERTTYRDERDLQGSRVQSREVRDRNDDRRRRDDNRDTGRGTSWLSVILGWLAALGAGLILAGIVSAIVGAILGISGAREGATEGAASGIVGLLITLLLAFLIGGYTAGRLASRQGLKHGLLVPVVAILATILLAGIGALLSVNLLDSLSGITLPRPPADTPQNLGTLLTGAGLLALLAPFIGGAIGGLLGARTGRNRP